MPVYDYKCANGHNFDKMLPVAEYKTPQNCPQCGAASVKLMTAPAVMGDFQAYNCPITGTLIDGRRAHEENLKRHGCRVLESGETSGYKESCKRRDTDLETKIEESAVEIVSKMESSTREQLGRELESGLDVTVVRQ